MQAREQLPGSGHRARALQVGRSGAGVSPAPVPGEGGASAVPAGGDLQPPGAGRLQRKAVPHFRRMLPAALEVGWLLGGPGSSVGPAPPG